MDRKYWHSAFCGATEWDLKKNKKDLKYEREHVLTKEPLRMDLLVIKKRPKAKIQSDIGKIFRIHNVVEFKGSGDALNIDVYHKIVAYACLYKSMGEHVDDIPAREVTITIIREAYPRELFKILKESDINIEERYPGIFYLTGNVMFPTQIIVTGRLGEKHSALKILSKKAKESDVRNFIQEARFATEPGDKENIDAVLQVSVSANKKLYKEVKEEDYDMCQALEELMKDTIEEKEDNVRLVDIRTLMKNMKLTAEQAMKALGISASDQAKYSSLL